MLVHAIYAAVTKGTRTASLLLYRVRAPVRRRALSDGAPLRYVHVAQRGGDDRISVANRPGPLTGREYSSGRTVKGRFIETARGSSTRAIR